MVLVYRFQYFNHKTGTYLEADDEYATAGAIREIGGRIVPGSVIDVEASRIGRAGYVLRKGR